MKDIRTLVGNQKAITREIKRLTKHRELINNRIAIIQNLVCSHVGVIKEPRGNTGNYDPSADYYWHDCKCPDCLKIWTEPQ